MIRPPKSSSQERSKVLAIVAIAVVPLVVAVIMVFFFPGLIPGVTTNQGTLVQPPVKINESSLMANGKWMMLISVNRQCDNTCKRVLYISRQVHISLGKDASRILRVIITGEDLSGDFLDLLMREYGTVEIINTGYETTSLLRDLAAGSGEGPVVFIMDPNGSIMMYYEPLQVGKPMRDDLKHLLKVSSIG